MSEREDILAIIDRHLHGHAGPQYRAACENIRREIERLPNVAQARPEPAAMTERLIQAAVDYEQAQGMCAAGARRELSEARAAIEAALALSPAERGGAA